MHNRAAPSDSAPTALPPATGLLRVVSSLRYRDWRYLWSGLMVAQTGEWMDNLAISWLVLILTESPLALGTVSLVRGIPLLLLSIPSGVIADRFDRRTLIIWTQAAGGLCTAVLAWLAGVGRLELWHIYVILLLRGTIWAFNQPARSSIIGDLVPRSDISNAIALHSAVFNATRMVGPAIAGFLIAASGPTIVLALNAAGNVLAALASTGMRRTAGRRPKVTTPALRAVSEGLGYIRHEPIVLMLLLLGVVPFVLGQPYQSMLPVFAKDVLVIGPEGLGMLTTASAAGAVTGAFGMSALGDVRHKGRYMMVGLLSFGLLLVAFSHTPWPVVAAILLFLVGVASQVYQTTNATLMQLIVPTEFRGRVFGIHQMDRGFIPVGSFIAGAIAEAAGAPFAIALLGSLLTAAGIGVFLFVPRMRKLD